MRIPVSYFCDRRHQTPPRLETLNINRWAGGPWAVRARAPAGQHGDRVILLPGSSDAPLILRFCACFLGIFKIGRQEKYFNKKIIGNKPFFTNSVLNNHIYKNRMCETQKARADIPTGGWLPWLVNRPSTRCLLSQQVLGLFSS